MFSRIAGFVYGVVCYLAFLGAFLFAIGFIGNFAVPKSIDAAPQTAVTFALAIDVLLLGLFAVQHSVMARQWFKTAWTRIVPAPVERSTYVLFSSLALFLLFWKWQPIGGVIWNVENATGRLIILALYAVGWLTVLVATFLINHFDLLGLRQVWLYLCGQPYTPLKFRTPGLYHFVRHPLYVGWLLVFWSAPLMTSAHLVFAIATTAYILIAIQFEERDLVRFHGEYEEYRRRVPMLLPIGSKMKKLITMLFIVGATLFTASRANAQVLVVTVPFDFAVAGKTMPAATYIVQDFKDSRLFAFMGDGQSTMVVATETDSTVTGGKLVFHRFGDEYFLSDMVTRSGKMHFAASARERRARRAAQHSLTTVLGN